MAKTIERVGIAEAALRLGLSYGQTLRLVLIGRLSGGKSHPTGKWYVSHESVEREASRRREAAGDVKDARA